LTQLVFLSKTSIYEGVNHT